MPQLTLHFSRSKKENARTSYIFPFQSTDILLFIGFTTGLFLLIVLFNSWYDNLLVPTTDVALYHGLLIYAASLRENVVMDLCTMDRQERMR